MLNSQFEKYYRPSVTYLMLDNPSHKYNKEMKKNFSAIAINSKFDDHRIDNKSFLDATKSSSAYLDKGSIFNMIRNEDIPRKMISKWYSQNIDGKFSMEFIAKRGLYNASDYDVMRAKAGARGQAALEDAGEELIKKSYIVVFDFYEIETWEDYYNRVDARNERMSRLRKEKFRPILRSQEGYKGNAKAYLYKVNWTDSLQQIFYEKAWNDPSFYNKMNIPITYEASAFMMNTDGSQPKYARTYSDDQLVQLLQKSVSESALRQFASKESSLKVKTSIFSTRPITAKVGKKEDVKIDQRFFVYELVQGNDDKKVPHYKGVIRATKKITDNRNDATGNSIPTQFYQEAGGKLYPGMMIEQDYDFGGSFNMGWQHQRLWGPFIRFDFNLSSLFNVSQLRFYIQGYLGFGTVKFGNSQIEHKVESKGVEFGFSKTYHLLRNFHIEPFAGLIIDTTHTFAPNFLERELLKNASINLGNINVAGVFGIRLPFNIKHNIQIVPTVAVNTISYNSEKTLFGNRLPSSFPNAILNTNGNQQGADNTNANLGISPFRYDVSMRIKF